ncbi:hypothetical protein SARC_03156 [Sphaeroforma arctica JP610]|uniref:Galactosyl transferase GMA12/MNN10 family protein n=1 Tax=Sphaeroforma arctica JP610 TaxID=667725 RepID=A0A0L0G6Y5_9EUKA|nr:hypothetical protein SARC_03156 [Sphaeroforma arctica JP610]KNC84626.1 hypothetical protein SARC_03156 [Sphaeroforma arctica JP610]|eukprot:XP_014158528.1 hypothetical protein SARC_03156 [Sphaeroforma arctica JP610]
MLTLSYVLLLYHSRWVETDGGLSEIEFEEISRGDGVVELLEANKRRKVVLKQFESWLKFDNPAHSDFALAKGRFVPRSLKYETDGQVFFLIGDSPDDFNKNRAEEYLYSLRKDEYSGNSVASYEVQMEGSDESVLLMEPDKGERWLALYTDGKVTQGTVATPVEEWEVLTEKGEWIPPQRSYMPVELFPDYDIYKFGSSESNRESGDPRRGDAKIAMVTLNTPNIAQYANLAEISQKHYAKKHGYDFYVYRDSTLDWDMERGFWDSAVTWNKVNAVPRHMPDHEWVMWIDSDAVITNLDITLESIIAQGEGKEFLIADDPGGWQLNTGVWFAKNTQWTRDMMQKWWQMPKHQHNMGAEQNQLIKLLNVLDRKKTMWKLYKECDFNCLQDNRFEGVFLIHFMGLWPVDKVKAIRKENVRQGLTDKHDNILIGEGSKDEL